MYPLEYQGKIEIPYFNRSEIDDYQKRLIAKAAEKLRLAKASRLEFQGNRINFRVNFFRLVSNWNILTQIDGGHIEVISASEKIIVSYLISFKKLIFISTLTVICFGINNVRAKNRLTAAVSLAFNKWF